MDLKITQLGNIQREMDEARADLGKAFYRGMKNKGDRLKNALRADVAKSGIRNAARVSKTWRGRMYPDKPGTLEPAYVVSNKAPWIFESLEKGPLIRFKGGGGLIPIGPAAKFKLPPFQARVTLYDKMVQQYGPLSAFKTRKGIMLGVWQQTAKGKQRFLGLFLIRREVKAPDLLDAEGIVKREMDRFPDDMMVEVVRVYEELQGRRSGGR